MTMNTITTTRITILALSLAITPVNAFIDNNNNRRHSRTSRIIGGIIAGVAVLLILLACCIARRRRMRAFSSGPIIGAGPGVPAAGGFGGGKPGLFGAGRWGNKHNDNLNQNQGYGGGYQQGGGGYHPGGGAPAAQSPPPYNNETRPQAQGYDAAPAQGQYAAPPGPPPQAHLNQPDQHQPFVGGFRT
ncbi:hypothetical protein R3P38DRAFT_1886615 [Favolaschia claudopus]|uniref:Uncharacterized protein n=1 Tax=Favolaschia claudopus TaxID=2862362 RepID=A0AAW0DFT3_9AGAR